MPIAQLNVAKIRYSLEDERMSGFVDNLEHINGLAESMDGFIWRLKDEEGDATSFQAFDDPDIISNLSVWQSVEALKQFVFHTEHKFFLARKKEWFVPMTMLSLVLWPIERDETPTLEQAVARLNYLREHGDSDYAHSFRSTQKA